MPGHPLQPSWACACKHVGHCGRVQLSVGGMCRWRASLWGRGTRATLRTTRGSSHSSSMRRTLPPLTRCRPKGGDPRAIATPGSEADPGLRSWPLCWVGGLVLAPVLRITAAQAGAGCLYRWMTTHQVGVNRLSGRSDPAREWEQHKVLARQINNSKRSLGSTVSATLLHRPFTR